MRFALANLLADIYQLDRQFDMDNMFSLLPNDDGPERTHPWKAIDHYQFADREDMPLIAMSHLEWDERFLSLPVVFLVRNPADTLVSWYYHLRFHEEKINIDIDQFIISSGIDDWITYIDSWIPHIENENVLLVSYEELKANPPVSFATLSSRLGIDADQRQLQAALDQSSLERMRRIERESGVGHNYDRSDPRASRVRKGRVGSWRQELSPETIDYLIDRLQSDQQLWQFVEGNNLNPLAL